MAPPLQCRLQGVAQVAWWSWVCLAPLPVAAPCWPGQWVACSSSEDKAGSNEHRRCRRALRGSKYPARQWRWSLRYCRLWPVALASRQYTLLQNSAVQRLRPSRGLHWSPIRTSRRLSQVRPDTSRHRVAAGYWRQSIGRVLQAKPAPESDSAHRNPARVQSASSGYRVGCCAHHRCYRAPPTHNSQGPECQCWRRCCPPLPVGNTSW